MRKSRFFLLAALTLGFVLACLTSVANFVVATLGAVNLSGELAFRYYEFLNFSAVSIAVPLAGMFLLAMSAPVLLRRRRQTAATTATESVSQPTSLPALQPAASYPKAA